MRRKNSIAERLKMLNSAMTLPLRDLGERNPCTFGPVPASCSFFTEPA